MLMFSGSNSGPNLKNTVEITAAYIYLAPQDGGKPKELNDLFVSNDALNDRFYSKAEVDGKVNPKADKVYVDVALLYKANSADVYTKPEANSLLIVKANAADVYSKTKVYTKTETYNKTELNTSMALLAPISTTYTKTQVDSSLAWH